MPRHGFILGSRPVKKGANREIINTFKTYDCLTVTGILPASRLCLKGPGYEEERTI
jgi:hypothetical protein